MVLLKYGVVEMVLLKTDIIMNNILQFKSIVFYVKKCLTNVYNIVILLILEYLTRAVARG